MIINKITKIYPENGQPISEQDIQDHFDIQNADGWYLVAISNLDGWYRFYWAKDVV